MKLLYELTPIQIQRIAKFADSEDGFSILENNEDQIVDIASEFDIKVADLLYILSVSEHIYENIQDKEISEEDLVNDLNILAKEINIKPSIETINALKLLFQKKAQYALKKTIELNKRGILPSVRGITSICDIKAIFDDKDSEIITYLPTIICRISTIDDKNEKQYISFQFTERTLKKFKTMIDNSIKKLEIVKKELKSKIDLYEEDKK